jgi:hypothetical protein
MPAEYKVKYARFSLGASRPYKHITGENLTEHDYHDEQGNKAGVVRLQERNDGKLLHIHWVGSTDVAGGEAAGSAGVEAMRSLMGELSTAYPNAEFISGIRAGGPKQNQRVVVPLKKQFAQSVDFNTVRNLYVTKYAISVNSPVHLVNTLIEKWKNFKSTPNHPYPGAAGGLTLNEHKYWSNELHKHQHFNPDELISIGDVHDLAAVISGSKPAALVDPSIINHPVGVELINRLKAKGHIIQKSPSRAKGESIYIIGQPANVNSLKEAYAAKTLDHVKIGKALGIAPEAIENYMKSLGKTVKLTPPPLPKNYLEQIKNEDAQELLRRGLPEKVSTPQSEGDKINNLGLRLAARIKAKQKWKGPTPQYDPNPPKPPLPKLNVPNRLSRQEKVVKYAETAPREVHPLVKGFRIEHFLHHIMNHEGKSATVRNLAENVLYPEAREGRDQSDHLTESLLQLHDALLDDNDPLVDEYRLPQAAIKVHHDAAVGHAIKLAAQVNRNDHLRTIRNMSDLVDSGYGVHIPIEPNDADTPEVAALTELRKHLSDKDINESLQRHFTRVWDSTFNSNQANKRKIEAGVNPSKHVQWGDEEASRYAKSPLHETFNKEFNKVADRLHAKMPTPDLEDFKSKDHFGKLLNIFKGNEEKATDLATDLLYGDTGTGLLEKHHQPDRPLAHTFAKLTSYADKATDRKEKLQLPGKRFSEIADDNLDNTNFESTITQDTTHKHSSLDEEEENSTGIRDWKRSSPNTRFDSRYVDLPNQELAKMLLNHVKLNPGISRGQLNRVFRVPTDKFLSALSMADLKGYRKDGNSTVLLFHPTAQTDLPTKSVNEEDLLTRKRKAEEIKQPKIKLSEEEIRKRNNLKRTEWVNNRKQISDEEVKGLLDNKLKQFPNGIKTSDLLNKLLIPSDRVKKAAEELKVKLIKHPTRKTTFYLHPDFDVPAELENLNASIDDRGKNYLEQLKTKTVKQIAKEEGLTNTSIKKRIIKALKTQADEQNTTPEKLFADLVKDNKPKAIADEKVRSIYESFKNGLGLNDISKKFGVSTNVANKYINRHLEQEAKSLGITPLDLRSKINRERMKNAHIEKWGWLEKEAATKPLAKIAADNNMYLSTVRKALNILKSYKANKYKKEQTPSPFVTALRKMNSTQQQVLHKVASSIYDKLKVDGVKLRNVIHDSPDAALANLAHKIIHDDRDKKRVAAAWYGLQTQTPSMMLFHIGDGPDVVHKISVTGSGDRLRAALDKGGFPQRTLLPNQTGWDALIYDEAGRDADNISKLASTIGGTIKSVSGDGELLGGSPAQVADEDARREYRSIIKQYEKEQSSGSVQPESADSERTSSSADTDADTPFQTEAAPTTTTDNDPFAY